MTTRRKAIQQLAMGAAGATGVAVGLVGAEELSGAPERGGVQSDPACDLQNPLLWAVAWKQTSAEYAALCHQGYNLARMLLDQALARHGEGDAPLAIITDVDDTIVHAGAYWAELIRQGMDFFDDDLWDAWIPTNQMTPVPGALDFFRYAADRGVEVFYITNRDQGEGTEAYALAHLQQLGFPFADMAHLTVLRETSNKEPARMAVAERFQVVLLLGDNLNDFRRVYYVDDVAERMARMEEDREAFGTRFIVFPNPTDGHWVRAIFGDSEPPPTDENRRRLRAAALGELG